MASAEQPLVRLEGVRKRFGEVLAVADVTLDVPRNGFFALLGPSGCGKTTLLRMLAGFEQPSVGRILIDGEDATHVPPNRRPVNMVFQSYAVFPHMSVAENGAVLQTAPPRQLYEQPACRFVADFIGTMNLLPARSIGRGTIEVEALGRLERREALPATGELTLGIRPEKLGVVFEERPGTGPRLHGRIARVTYLGAASNLLVELASGHRLSVLTGNHGPEASSALIPGRRCWLTFDPDAAVLLAD